MSDLAFAVAIFDYNPYSFVPDVEQLEQSYGFNVDLMNFLKKNLNFTVTLTSPTDGTFGQADAEGRWNGVVGMCQRGDIDFSASLISATLPR